MEMEDSVAHMFDDGVALPFPPLPDDLDDLDDLLMQFLGSEEDCDASSGGAVADLGQAKSLLQEVAAAALATPSRPASSGSADSTPAHAPASSCDSEGSSPAAPTGAAYAGSGAMRLVTTALGACGAAATGAASQLVAVATAAVSHQLADVGAAARAAHMASTAARSGGVTGTSRQGSGDAFSSGDSSDTDEDMEDDAPGGGSYGVAGGGGGCNKRKAPDVDWRAIADPAERRRQRRLAKNRVTAARSRERKKCQWSKMEAKLQGVENDNMQLRAMLEQFARENSALKQQLMALAAGGGSACAQPGASGPNAPEGGRSTEPAVLILIATLLVLLCLLPGDKALALLGSALPALLAAQMLRSGADASSKAMLDALLRMLHSVGSLLARSGRAARRSMAKLLYARQQVCGIDVMAKLANVAEDSWLPPRGLGLSRPTSPSIGGVGGWCAAYSPQYSAAFEDVSSAFLLRPLAGGVYVKPEPVF